ncbi:hypothetical protein HGM15179_018947 [Zosterops borbonicus]|uniref:Uncharacterized protein n=1 Tax=Zosterops borbonicus TaxID=364589 RepID=A0A8K1D907_9PASS|nr:hypothetical protein HGM15179_018947 [Zosterops borbonicus]
MSSGGCEPQRKTSLGQAPGRACDSLERGAQAGSGLRAGFVTFGVTTLQWMHPLKRPMLEQFLKNCSLWEMPMFEKFMEDCRVGVSLFWSMKCMKGSYP